MRIILFVCVLMGIAASSALGNENSGKKSKLKFWNLTGFDLVEVVLAPAGTDKFGANQTLNDDNNAIENDERLPLVGVTAGIYDVRIKAKTGRTCLVKNVQVKEGAAYAFSIEADQLTDCTP